MAVFWITFIWCFTFSCLDLCRAQSAERDYCHGYPQYTGPVPPGYTVAYPELITKRTADNGSASNSTRLPDGSYLLRFTMKIQINTDEKHRILLKLNDLLIDGAEQSSTSESPTDERTTEVDKSLIPLHKLTNCYYSGKCRKHRDIESIAELVMVSTCYGGIRGYMSLNKTQYSIRPADDALYDDPGHCMPHFISVLDPGVSGQCWNNQGYWEPFNELETHRTEYTRRIESQPDSGNFWIRLGIVVDPALVREINPVEFNRFIINTINMVDMYFKETFGGIQLSLSFVKLLGEGQTTVKISPNPRETLQNLLEYTFKMPSDMEFDVVHLLTPQRFDREGIGMSIPDSVCSQTGRAAAVETVSVRDGENEAAATIAHMLGHNLGLLHDGENCGCKDSENGCIMQTMRPSGRNAPHRFSQCSKDRLQTITAAGLLDCRSSTRQTPSASYPQYCGNGEKERGEECDCGSQADCLASGSCCNATTCLLKATSQCLSGVCCHGCKYITEKKVCREAVSECDVPEFCDGTSGECPSNSLVRNGEPCGGGEGYCRWGDCPLRSVQCQAIWGKTAEAGDRKCYEEQNTIGNAQGHCGLDLSTGVFKKCDPKDSLCGLLQCQGGEAAPLSSVFTPGTVLTDTSTETRVCKTVSNQAPSAGGRPPLEMVAVGTKCGEGLSCTFTQNTHECREISHNPPSQCPIGGPMNNTCSGNGKCTDTDACFCDFGYDGFDCANWLNLTLPPPSEDRSLNSTAAPSQEGFMFDIQLVALVVVSVIIIFVLAVIIIFCYRRRNLVKSTTDPANFPSSSYTDSADSFGFGGAPSAMNKHDRKRKRRRHHHRRKPRYDDTSSDDDDTQDEMDMGGRRRRQSPIRYNIPIPEELSRQPEKSILKKTPSFGINTPAAIAARNGVPYYSDEGERSSDMCSCSGGECGHGACSCSDADCAERGSHGACSHGSCSHTNGSCRGGSQRSQSRGSNSHANESLHISEGEGEEGEVNFGAGLGPNGEGLPNAAPYYGRAPSGGIAGFPRVVATSSGMIPTVAMDTNDYSVVYAPAGVRSGSMSSGVGSGPALPPSRFLNRRPQVTPPPLPPTEESSPTNSEDTTYASVNNSGQYYRQFSSGYPDRNTTNGPNVMTANGGIIGGLLNSYNPPTFDRSSQQDSATDSAIEMNDHHLPLEALSISSSVTATGTDSNGTGAASSPPSRFIPPLTLPDSLYKYTPSLASEYCDFRSLQSNGEGTGGRLGYNAVLSPSTAGHYVSPPSSVAASDELDISSHKQLPVMNGSRDSTYRLQGSRPAPGHVLEPPMGPDRLRSGSEASSIRETGGLTNGIIGSGDCYSTSEPDTAFPEKYRKLSLSTFQPLPPKPKLNGHYEDGGLSNGSSNSSDTRLKRPHFLNTSAKEKDPVIV